MRTSESRRVRLDLDLSPPIRLDLWAVALASGIVAGTVVPPFASALVLGSLLICVGSAIWSSLLPRGWRLMGLLCPLFVAAGAGIAYLHAAARDPLAELAALEPGEVVAVGTVASPPAPSGAGNRAELRVEHLWLGDRELVRGGKVQIRAFDLRAGVGDRVRVDGEIVVPDSGGEFDYARHLRTRGVSAEIRASGVWPVDEGRGWIGQVHRRTDAALSHGMRSEEASMVRGILIGDRSRIPDEMQDAFRRSGIAHILAISGMHVAVLATASYFALRALALPLATRNAATLALVWVYVVVAGAPPSAIRAGVIASFVLLAPLLKRGISPLHFMTCMLALVLAWNPMLIYSTGFQLSVAAVFGILLLRKPLQAFLKRTVLRPLPAGQEPLSRLMSISLAAQIATAPIIATSFGEVPVVGVITNLVAVPLAAPILTLGLCGVLTGNLLPALAYPVNSANGFLVSVMWWTAELLASLPFAAVETANADLALAVLFYVACAPAAAAASALPEERWPAIGGLLVFWAALWLAMAVL